ncbi:MAG: type II toxin-antitoxin system VapC family toxin [Pseudomonadota bacterium]
MDNRNILIDTSVIIDFLRKKNKRKSALWDIKAGYNCFMSVISEFELWAGALTEQKKEDITKIVKWIKPIPFDSSIAEISARFHQDLKSRNEGIEFRDIFIAATALYHKYPLATLNIKHFGRFPEIRIFPGIPA